LIKFLEGNNLVKPTNPNFAIDINLKFKEEIVEDTHERNRKIRKSER
jgi:hypothetical protein